MADRFPEAEMVLDDELMFDDAPRRSTFLRRDDRVEDIVREGEVLAGKYRVERIPGRSGLGVLVQVRHMELGQEVTLKFLVPEACAYPEFVQRFVREARAAVKIQGEHVARVTDVGRLESGAPYMVREFLRGPDLAEVAKVRGPLPIVEAVDYVIQACEGIAEGHALGVVHRNLRPTSLVVTRRSDGTPLVKVLDFAAAESLHVNPFTERAVSLIGTSAIMASLPYMAPEQIRDPHDVDFRADVYALGAILFELLTGSPVYSADSAPALLAMVAADAAPSMRQLREDLPGELDHLVLRCLAKNRAIRYPSIADFVLALRPFASAETASSVERVIRLAKRTAKVPDSERPAALQPAPSSPPAAGRHGTLLTHTQRLGSKPISHDDVTAINPYSSYGLPPVPVAPAAPVIVDSPRTGHPQPLGDEPVRTQPLPLPLPLPLPRPRASEPARYTPTPPPLRPSVPPALHAPMTAQTAPSVVPPAPSVRPGPGGQTTELPPRSSMSGMSRSWAAPEEPAAPLFTQKRLIALGAIAACASLGAVLAFRVTSSQLSARAAAAPAATLSQPAPAPPVVPAAAPAALPEPAAVPSAPLAAAAPPAVAPPAAAPPAVAPLAVAPPGAAPAPQPVAVVRPQAPRPAAVPKAPKAPREAAQPSVSKTQASEKASEKVASTRPASTGDLFADPQ